MEDGGRALGEFPLGCLRCEVDVVVLAGVLVEMGNPAFGERRRGLRGGDEGRSVLESALAVLLRLDLVLVGEGWVSGVLRGSSCGRGGSHGCCCLCRRLLWLWLVDGGLSGGLGDRLLSWLGA